MSVAVAQTHPISSSNHRIIELSWELSHVLDHENHEGTRVPRWDEPPFRAIETSLIQTVVMFRESHPRVLQDAAPWLVASVHAAQPRSNPCAGTARYLWDLSVRVVSCPGMPCFAASVGVLIAHCKRPLAPARGELAPRDSSPSSLRISTPRLATGGAVCPRIVCTDLRGSLPCIERRIFCQDSGDKQRMGAPSPTTCGRPMLRDEARRRLRRFPRTHDCMRRAVSWIRRRRSELSLGRPTAVIAT